MTRASGTSGTSGADAAGGLRARAQRALGAVADGLTRLRVRRRIAAGRLDDVTIVAYHGWGTTGRLHLRARVLESGGLAASSATDPWWANAWGIVRRFASAEIPGAELDVDVAGTVERVTTGPEGHAELTAANPHGATGWVPVRWTLRSPTTPEPVERIGAALVPRSDAAFGVISDLDDTVVRTGVTDRVSMLRTVLFSNARTRLPFPGVDAFYDALADGGRNPVFYVSTSPWNLYDVLEEFLRARGIPAGPMFLTDWGVDERTFGQPDTHAHKGGSIQRVLDAYPDLRFVLIGDSGQHDPEIYAEVIASNPGRVLAVYIRDVRVPGRQREVDAVARRVARAGVDLVHSADTLDAARHATTLGLVDDAAVQRVARGSA